MLKPESQVRDNRPKPIRAALKRARSLIDTEDKWCREYATPDGKICAVHALQKARAQLNYLPVRDAPLYRALGEAMGVASPECGPMIGHWNDTHSHAEVLAAFDRAIAASE